MLARRAAILGFVIITAVPKLDPLIPHISPFGLLLTYSNATNQLVFGYHRNQRILTRMTFTISKLDLRLVRNKDFVAPLIWIELVRVSVGSVLWDSRWRRHCWICNW